MSSKKENMNLKEKKGLSFNNRRSNGIKTSAFTEPLKRDSNNFKITSWTEKSNEDDKFLYQNVSNTGTNYIEYKLKNMIKNDQKMQQQSDTAKNNASASVPCPFVPNRQIEVRTMQNRTVVKISVDSSPLSEPNPSSFFKPVENHISDYQYPEVCFTTQATNKSVAEYAEPFVGLYANVDFSKKKSRMNKESLIYENASDDSAPVNLYMNLNSKKVDDGEIYVNVEESDQVYENEDFTVLRNSKVTQSIIESHSLPMTENNQVYENGQFVTNGNIMESIQFAGPFVTTTNGYDTPRSLRLIVNETEKEKIQLDGQFSPSETFDSGTGSDLECNSKAQGGAKIVVTVNSEKGHKRAESVTSSGVGIDSEVSDEEVSNISSDSLNSADDLNNNSTEDHGYHTPSTSDNKAGSPVDDIETYKTPVARKLSDESDIIKQVANATERIKSLRLGNAGIYQARVYDPSDNEVLKTLPEGLLKDIKTRKVRLLSAYPNASGPVKTQISPPIIKQIHPKVTRDETSQIVNLEVDTDKFYKFHLKENLTSPANSKDTDVEDDESFAGFKDYLNRERSSAITSAKGTIRGVRNRVKAGIATFLQLQQNKAYRDRDSGKVVVYSTTMGIVRETYQNCLKVKQILRTLLVKFEERNVFMSRAVQDEIRERMKCDAILVPQVFVEGQHIGDAETIEKLNESGELRRILKPYKSKDACAVCDVCGDYRVLLCPVCKGSKKSVHRNTFTEEFVSLKCMYCDPAGLTKCLKC